MSISLHKSARISQSFWEECVLTNKLKAESIKEPVLEALHMSRYYVVDRKRTHLISKMNCFNTKLHNWLDTLCAQ